MQADPSPTLHVPDATWSARPRTDDAVLELAPMDEAGPAFEAVDDPETEETEKDERRPNAG